MKKIFLFSLVFSFGFSVANAEMLRPPSLLEVMKRNEEIAFQNAQRQAEISQTEEEKFSYTKIFSGKAIEIHKANEANLWVQKISLDKGAKIISAQEVVSYNAKTGEPQFQKNSITETLNSLPEAPTTLINGQFFNPKTQPSELSFGLKADGIVRTAGADNGREKKNILHIGENFAEILPYSWKNLDGTTGKFAMVNLTLDNPRHKNEKIGRTYMCLANPDKNNRSSTLLVFTAQAMSEPRIEKEIFRFGCTKKSTSKLDSSGSTRLYFGGNMIFGHNHKGDSDKRIIPHYIAIYDGK